MKKFAGEEQLTTSILPLAQSERNRSILHDEWSGPWPSSPWGRSNTNEVILRHRYSEHEIT